MRDRPKTKSQRKAWGQAQTADVAGRVAAVTNGAIGQSADRLGTPSAGDGQALNGRSIL